MGEKGAMNLAVVKLTSSATRGALTGGGASNQACSQAEPYAVNDFLAVGREPSGVLVKMRKPEGLRPTAKTSSNTGNKSFTA
ncbi:hypothetical protein CKO51_08210 [Rhodopirellula sp. SM50]|nr:hypothetical protein CKO51_08210 [Rhodopirellula sp. SM50]